ncbi:MAG: YqjF family protein [Acidimicrobiales bacterium]
MADDRQRADPASCPYRIERPVMRHRWERLTFLHWPFDPAAVQRLLPDGLEVETAEGAAWVGLVPFFMKVAAPFGPPIPWAGSFCETNVRTYARDRHGHSGVWFLSLDAARLAPVLTARVTFRLPYFWSLMQLQDTQSAVTYDCRRRWPGAGPRSHCVIEIGAPFLREELVALDHFLTARWILFSSSRRGLRFTRASHTAWPLQRASVLECDDELVAASGLPKPNGLPLAHYSPGVSVRIGAPHLPSGR